MKKIKVFIVLVVLAISVNSQTNPPAIEWQKCFGGSAIYGDDAYSIQQTRDGGYIVAGESMSNDGDVTGNHGSYDYWVIKLDSAGNIQWQKSLGGSFFDAARSIQQTTDGGYIVAGITGSNDGDVSGFHGGYDYWIVKLDSTGNLQWEKSLGGTNDENAFSIQQTKDGGYIVAGFTCSNDGDVTGFHGGYDYWIVKLDTIGNIQWEKSLGGFASDIAYSIQQTKDGGYIIAGSSNSNNGDVTQIHYINEYWIVKLDFYGNLLWQKCLGGNSDDYAYSIQQTNDGGYIVAGVTGSNDGDVSGNHSANLDYWIVKIDTIGNIQWQKCLGGSLLDNANSITQTIDGGYIVAGWSYSNDYNVTGNHGGYPYGDFWLVKLDTIGNLQWEKCLGGTGGDGARSIQQTTDGGYIVAGRSMSNDGDVSGNHGGLSDYWVVKLCFGCNTLGIEEETILEDRLEIYPNPTKETINITNAENSDISIYNMLGEVVLKTKCSAANATINVSGLSEGAYIIKIVLAKNVVTRQLIIGK